MHRYHVVPPVVFQCWVNAIPPTLTSDPHVISVAVQFYVFIFFSHRMSGTTLGDIFSLVGRPEIVSHVTA